MTIVAQIGIAIVPWVMNDNWGIMLITLAGTTLAVATSCLPQWKDEKWAGGLRPLQKDNVMCLTRGNGHKHIMIFLGMVGSPDLEKLATAKTSPRIETPYLTLLFAFLWIGLLFCVAGVEEQTWYLVGIGGLGMLQNVYAAGATRKLDTAGFAVQAFQRMPTIISTHQDIADDEDATVDLTASDQDVSALYRWTNTDNADDSKMPGWLKSMHGNGVPIWLEPLKMDQVPGPAGTHGALQELEKWLPGAGLALLPTFFPGSLGYRDEDVKEKRNKKFWKRAVAYETNQTASRGIQAQKRAR